ncbi:MAG: acyclic terpene utilization AtuA family protein, partial [Hyphomicrobiaceae bacterium]
MSEPLRMMATTGLLGYGFSESAFRHGLRMGLDFIAADGGSMDPGPYYLGKGVPFVTRMAIKRDIGLMLEGALDLDIPMIIGSTGGGGSAAQLTLVRDVVEEIAAERNYRFKLAEIGSEQG